MLIHVKLSALIMFILISVSSLSQKPMSFEEKPFPVFNLNDNAVLNFCSSQP